MATNMAIDNTIREAIITLDQAQVNVHQIHDWIAEVYPDIMVHLNNKNHRIKQVLGYGMRRLSKLDRPMLRNIGKAYGAMLYEVLGYDRTPDRGMDKPEPSLCPKPVVKEYSSDGKATTFVVPEKDIRMEMIEKLMEQNERLIDAIVSMIK